MIFETLIYSAVCLWLIWRSNTAYQRGFERGVKEGQRALIFKIASKNQDSDKKFLESLKIKI